MGARGILLMGSSGIGKSDLALRLIDRGARLVADDRCIVTADAGRVMCRPPANLAGKLEVRGVGIVTLPFVAPVRAVVVVRLADRYERLPVLGWEEVVGVRLPSAVLAPFETSAPVKVDMVLAQLDAA